MLAATRGVKLDGLLPGAGHGYGRPGQATPHSYNGYVTVELDVTYVP